MNKITSILIFTIILIVTTNCKKVAFYGDYCSGDCYIISGQVFHDSTNYPLRNVSIKLKATDGILIKSIVQSTSNDSGFWKMSFDANYIEDIQKGTIVFTKDSFFVKEQIIYFDKSELNIEKNYSSDLPEMARLKINLNITNKKVDEVKVKYNFEDQTYNESVKVSGEKPNTTILDIAIPADKDITLNLFYRGNSNTWTLLSVKNVIVPAHQTNEIEINY